MATISIKMFSINTSTGAFIDSGEWCITAAPYGMAWDGSYLWQSEAFNHLIHKIDIGFNSAVPPATSIAKPALAAFPNPASSMVEFSSITLKGMLVIRNTCGVEVHRVAMDEKNISIAVDQYASGIYTAYLYKEEGRIASAASFVVQK